MSDKNIQESLKSYAVKKALTYLEADPEKNLPKLLAWVDLWDKEERMLPQRTAFHEILQDPRSNWYKLLMSLWTDIDDEVRKRVFENFIVNASLIGMPRQAKYREKHGCSIPWAILMDPTSACNLHCIGCWAADYGNKMRMSTETLSDIIRQGKAMGTYFYIYSGGEPLVRKEDIIKLCRAYPDCQFLAFTNGTLIDEKFADDMLAVKNFIPAISVEGFEEETDFRRGAGTYRAVVAAMKLLQAKKLPFGVSCCYTSKNTEVVGSEDYIDEMIGLGAKFAWFFTYMPIGNEAAPELMATAEQREYMYHQVREFRKTKPLFTIDFWNDGEYVKGCIAGGRCYLHINANGDIEPCAFIHYSDSSIYDKTLLEAYKSPLFMAYHNSQPFNENYLRPCPLLDNPGALTRMVTDSEAKSTDLKSPEDVRALSAKCEERAADWAQTADRLWSCTYSCVRR